MSNMEMNSPRAKEYAAFFRKCLPFAVRSEKEVERILGGGIFAVEERLDDGRLKGLAAVSGETIYLLCVDEGYRGQGIGSRLLARAESHIRESGHVRAVLGVGESYLMPGVPTSVRPYDEILGGEKLYPELNDGAVRFFEKRGYVHGWNKCNCFDMRSDLDAANLPYSVGDTVGGILYRWAGPDDIGGIVECTDDACDDFTVYYRDPKRYAADSEERVLIALDGDTVVGTLIVSEGSEEAGTGSVGCTTVRHSHQGRHIGVNMTIAGNRYLRDIGLRRGFLGYTYSGLDRMYGYAGYKICCYYFMGEKTL